MHGHVWMRGGQGGSAGPDPWLQPDAYGCVGPGLCTRLRTTYRLNTCVQLCKARAGTPGGLVDTAKRVYGCVRLCMAQAGCCVQRCAAVSGCNHRSAQDLRVGWMQHKHTVIRRENDGFVQRLSEKVGPIRVKSLHRPPVDRTQRKRSVVQETEMQPSASPVR